MNISPDFSPSIKIMKPYFILSSSFYLLSIVWLFFIDPYNNLDDFEIVAWVHIYMLGFVMMGIFSAMAQLGPIIVEKKHFNVNVFKYVWVVLTLGLILMLIGFLKYLSFLLLGGSLVLLAMSIYAIEFLLTLKNAKRNTTITKAMTFSNFFLLAGIMSGLLMALSYNSYIDINPKTFLQAHTFGLLVGFVILLIMGISIILIPMFGYAKRISDNEFSSTFYTLSLAVMLMILSPIFLTPYLQNTSYIISIIAIILYLYQLYKMTSSRAKVIHDIWSISMYVGFISFIVSFIFLVSYLFTHDTNILRLGMWILFIGFFGFLITGNFYKIIPFLVWFQVYSPLIEERAVPMLHDLLPKKLPILQWLYATLGLIVSSFGLYFEDAKLFYAGLCFLLSSAFILSFIINKTLKHKI